MNKADGKRKWGVGGGGEEGGCGGGGGVVNSIFLTYLGR